VLQSGDVLDLNKKFEELIEAGQRLGNEGEARSWSYRVRQLLYQIYGRDVADEFEAVWRSRASASWPDGTLLSNRNVRRVSTKARRELCRDRER
jgi:hypothetical protein